MANFDPTLFELLSLIILLVAIGHTFCCGIITHQAHRFPARSWRRLVLHVLGEVELVFGIWGAVLILLFVWQRGAAEALLYMRSRSFTEPLFVFVIMTIAASGPVVGLAKQVLVSPSKLLKSFSMKPQQSAKWQAIVTYFSCLTIAPLMGSLITEPAAMTVAALILLEIFYRQKVSQKFRYITIAALFVNISIGGVLTNFAAPPVLMVAAPWGWTNSYMFTNFGVKAVIAVLLNAGLSTWLMRDELKNLDIESSSKSEAQSADQRSEAKTSMASPIWLQLLHVGFLLGVVLVAHHPEIFLGIFCAFLLLTQMTKRYQAELKIRQSLLVGFFLAGLIVLGGVQSWWLEPVLTSMNDHFLFFGTCLLTAITDNAALTYLGSQIPNLAESSKHALLGGAVVGGGLTVIANAPNPAGYAILNSSFGEDGISALKLFLFALLPTSIAAIVFLIL